MNHMISTRQIMHFTYDSFYHNWEIHWEVFVSWRLLRSESNLPRSAYIRKDLENTLHDGWCRILKLRRAVGRIPEHDASAVWWRMTAAHKLWHLEQHAHLLYETDNCFAGWNARFQKLFLLLTGMAINKFPNNFIWRNV